MIDREETFDPRLEAALRAAAPDRFEPGFASRVSARIVADRAAFGDVLQQQFVRIVPIIAAASLVLGAYNWWSARSSSASALDALLRLPHVTIAEAYSSDALYAKMPAVVQP